LFRTVSLVAVALTLLGGNTTRAEGESDVTLYKIQSRWYQNEFLQDAEGAVRHAPGEGDTFLWMLVERGEGLHGLRNKGTGRELRLEGETVLATAATDAGTTASWIVDIVSGEWVSIRNAANKRFVNLAVGGASGWPTDLSRYNGIADLYVDYVRVFQGKVTAQVPGFREESGDSPPSALPQGGVSRAKAVSVLNPEP
jgi:hypothetical protein